MDHDWVKIEDGDVWFTLKCKNCGTTAVMFDSGSAAIIDVVKKRKALDDYTCDELKVLNIMEE